MKKKLTKWIAVMAAAGLMLTACGADAYASYAAAYNKVSENGGIDANIDMTVTMDGTTTQSKGSFKLDTSGDNSILYYEMTVGGSKVTQFSDGKYLYTDSDSGKTKYALDAKPSGGDRQKSDRKDAAPSFDASAFLSEFSSCLEAGKIKEMGLLSPIQKAAVTNISEKDGVYTLEFSDSVVKKYLNTLIANETQKSDGDTLRIDEMKGFSYKAVAKDSVVTEVTYSGTIIVNVPASLMSSGSDQSYDMDFTIRVSYVNPGAAVSVTLPSTDDYKEL